LATTAIKTLVEILLTFYMEVAPKLMLYLGWLKKPIRHATDKA
jgi:hypothetical protein